MTRFTDANLIRVFDFYLASMLLLSFFRRRRVYLDALRLLVVMPFRYPKLILRLREHHDLLPTGEVLRPLGVASGLTLVQMICSRMIWPHAKLAVGEILESPGLVVMLLVMAFPMLAVDFYFLIRIGNFDRKETEKSLKQAENWLGWRSAFFRRATLGYFNPTRVVDAEVRKSLDLLAQTVGWAAWWVAAQVGCRVIFGLTVWLMWYLYPG